MAMVDRQYAHDAKPKLFYQAKFDRDINEVGIQSRLNAPCIRASDVGTLLSQGLAVLQHSEGCLPFHRIRLVLVEEPSPDKPFDIPLLLDMCGGCFNLTCVLCFYAAVGCWHAC